MRILVDENIPRMTVDVLRGLGNDVKDIRGTPAQGLPDSELWWLTTEEARLLNRNKIHGAVMRAIQQFHEPDWSNLFVVVRDTTMSTSRSGSQLK